MLYSEWKELMHLSVDDNGKSNDIAKRRRDLSDIFEFALHYKQKNPSLAYMPT